MPECATADDETGAAGTARGGAGSAEVRGVGAPPRLFMRPMLLICIPSNPVCARVGKHQIISTGRTANEAKLRLPPRCRFLPKCRLQT
jgi:hypothetical protein